MTAAAADLEAAIQTSQEAVQQQGDVVRSLKANVKDGNAAQVWGVARSTPRSKERLQQLLPVLPGGTAGGCSDTHPAAPPRAAASLDASHLLLLLLILLLLLLLFAG